MVLSGDVARARKAAERLFGLRLDDETQVQLAAQVSGLGMHDLAEAVLARARRRAGGDASSLVGLMSQCQRQGKADVAIQVAGQTLRQTAGSRQQAMPGSSNQNDQARTEAVNVFARSGRLKDLIARAEAQIAASPTSLPILQTLVDYYQADGRKAKVEATYERMAGLRADDARLRFQIASQHARAGSPGEAVEHYKAAIAKEPALFMNGCSEVQNAFIQAGKADELVKHYEAIDFKAFANNPHVVINAVQSLIGPDKTRGRALALLRKAWKGMPASRSHSLASLYNDQAWQTPPRRMTTPEMSRSRRPARRCSSPSSGCSTRTRGGRTAGSRPR